ncbi:MAG TPA: hypothetical protein VJX67_03565 [Blastocatellia bacterium]|nr:hypothetical protein [Blastocatellia bacterium]
MSHISLIQRPTWLGLLWTFLFMPGLLLAPASGWAQQRDGGSSHVPNLTSDDVARTRARATATTVALDGTPIYTPGNLGLALELPSPPKLLESQMLSKNTVGSKCFASAGRGVGVFIEYSAEASSGDLTTYAKEFVREVKFRAGISDLDYSTQPGTPSRVQVFGAFKVTGVPGELNGVALSSNGRAWVVLTVYPRDSEPSHDLADRILRSIMTVDATESAAGSPVRGGAKALPGKRDPGHDRR